jgi:hypothetical protein
VFSAILKAESYVKGWNRWEERYKALTEWVNSGNVQSGLILVSYSYRIHYLASDNVRNKILDIGNTPLDMTEFLRYLAMNDVRFVVYDPLWSASLVRFENLPKCLLQVAFEPVFSRSVGPGPPLIIYKNLLNKRPIEVYTTQIENWCFEG